MQMSNTAPVPMKTKGGCHEHHRKLSFERQIYCCEHFNLHCPDDEQDETFGEKTLVKKVSGLEENGKRLFKQPEGIFKLLQVRKLGESCASVWVRCATGLECRLGFCVRLRGPAHLHHLIEIGKQVEEEEKSMAIEDDDESGDPLSADLVVHGQSIELEDDTKVPVSAPMALFYGQEGSSSQYMSITSPTRASEDKDCSTMTTKIDHNDSANLLDIDKAATSGDEEDELTGNIADYLASKGKKLSEKEWHTIRELISGTLDERAQRDEQVRQVEVAEKDLKNYENLEGQGDTQGTSVPSTQPTGSKQPRCNLLID